MPEPSLTPVPPAPGAPVVLGSRSPFWIGSAPDSGLPILVPGVAARHVALVEREDGWWVSASAPAGINGRPLTQMARLADGDVITVATDYAYRFSSGEAAPAVAPAPPAHAPRRKKRSRPPRAPGTGPSPRLIATVAGIVLLLAAAGAAIWFAAFRSDRSAGVMTDAQALALDSLLVTAYDHIERGNTLLELGLADVAAGEFARGINTLALSGLRDHPAVKPRITALEASVAGIYRERKLQVPRAYANAPAAAAVAPDRVRPASLSAGEFAAAFAAVAGAFEARFGDAITVTGRDHAEHVGLYGRGGALDLRTRTMTDDQVQFVVAECRSRGIRVKDFSQDAVLQRQIAAATKAGLLDRAGTGLHLHIDRFANRRDRWTASRPGLTSSGTSFALRSRP